MCPKIKLLEPTYDVCNKCYVQLTFVKHFYSGWLNRVLRIKGTEYVCPQCGMKRWVSESTHWLR